MSDIQQYLIDEVREAVDRAERFDVPQRGGYGVGALDVVNSVRRALGDGPSQAVPGAPFNELDALALKALQDACLEVIKAWGQGSDATGKALRQLAELLPDKPEVWP